MRKFVYALLLIVLLCIAFSSELLDFIPSWKPSMYYVSWLAFLLFAFISITGLKTIAVSQGKLGFWTLLIVVIIALVIKVFVFFMAKSQEKMYPLKLLDKSTDNENKKTVYIFSFDNFPDPGTGVVLKKQVGFLPILREVKRINNFEFSEKIISKDSIIYYSEQGTKLSYCFSSGEVAE